MTVNEVFDLSLSLLPSNRQADSSLMQYAVGWINLAMAETFNVENAIRESGGLQPLTAIPTLTADSDVIPYHESLTRYAFPYFVASFAAKDDDDDYWSQDYRARYVVAVAEAAKVIPRRIIDVYSGDD